MSVVSYVTFILVESANRSDRDLDSMEGESWQRNVGKAGLYANTYSTAHYA